MFKSHGYWIIFTSNTAIYIVAIHLKIVVQTDVADKADSRN